jgi:hypothetical protein
MAPPQNRSKERFNQRTTITLVLFLFFLIASLYFIGILPTPRIPSSWMGRTPRVATDPNAKITRGAIEAKKTHKDHTAINPDLELIPNKYISSPTGLPLGNYVIMIDAGSSGSRVYVYQYKLPFSIDDKTNEVIYATDISADVLHVAVAEDANHNPIVRKQEPGLSSFHNNPNDAFSSIEPLLHFAAQNIPEPLHSKTPIYIMATAGLRLISEESRDLILDNLRQGLRRWSQRGKFLFQRDDQADLITGELEGLYGWIALNYIYNRFGDLKRTYPTGGLDPHTYAQIPRVTNKQYREKYDTYQADKYKNRPNLAAIIDDPVLPNGDNLLIETSPPTVALLEIGGGSAQVAFAVADGSSSHPAKYVYPVDLNLLHCDYALHAADNEINGIGKNDSNKIELRTDSTGQKWPVGGHNYNVYSASFLGHGANAARTRYVNYLIKSQNGEQSPHPSLILDPCGIWGQADIVTPQNGWGKGYHIPAALYSTFKHPQTSDFLKIDTNFLRDNEVLLVGTGNWTTCRQLLPQLLPPTPPEFSPDAKGPRCAFNCPINDQYQPVLTPELLAKTQFFGFSEYWFLTRDVIRLDPTEFTGELFDRVSKELCDVQTGKQDWGTVFDNFNRNKFPDSANEQRIRQQCFKGAWMSTMLHDGHGLPQNNQKKLITPVSSIEGSEVQWSLGAVLLKITEILKKDRGVCLDLARASNKHGLASFLYSAQRSFQEDEHTRLAQNDYWGTDAGWEQGFFLWIWFFAFAVVSIIALALWLYQICIGKQETALYTNL